MSTMSTPKNIKLNQKYTSGSKSDCKKFFTPIRRLGLSRKVPLKNKTVSPKKNECFAQDVNDINNDNNILESNDSSYSTKSEDLKKLEFNFEKLKEESDVTNIVEYEKLSEVTEQNKNVTDKENKRNSDEKCAIIKNSVVLNEDECNKICNDSVENLKEVNLSEDNTFCRKKTNKNLNVKKSKVKLFSFQYSSTSDSEDDFIPSLKSSQECKTSENLNIESLLKDSIVIERVNIQSLKTDKVKIKNKIITKPKFKEQKIDLCYCSDEDFEPLSFNKSKKKFDSKSHSNFKDLKNEILSLRQQIKKKESILSELKLTETYKNLHNVEELLSATKIWTESFKIILNELISELKSSNREMNVSDILRKLNLKESLVKLNSFD